MSDDAIEQAIVDSIKSINDEQEKRSSKRTVPPLLDMPKVSMNVGGSGRAAKRALGKFKERSKSFGKRSGGKKGGGGEEVVEASGDGLSLRARMTDLCGPAWWAGADRFYSADIQVLESDDDPDPDARRPPTPNERHLYWINCVLGAHFCRPFTWCRRCELMSELLGSYHYGTESDAVTYDSIHSHLEHLTSGAQGLVAGSLMADLESHVRAYVGGSSDVYTMPGGMNYNATRDERVRTILANEDEAYDGNEDGGDPLPCPPAPERPTRENFQQAAERFREKLRRELMSAAPAAGDPMDIGDAALATYRRMRYTTDTISSDQFTTDYIEGQLHDVLENLHNDDYDNVTAADVLEEGFDGDHGTALYGALSALYTTCTSVEGRNSILNMCCEIMGKSCTAGTRAMGLEYVPRRVHSAICGTHIGTSLPDPFPAQSVLIHTSSALSAIRNALYMRLSENTNLDTYELVTEGCDLEAHPYSFNSLPFIGQQTTALNVKGSVLSRLLPSSLRMGAFEALSNVDAVVKGRGQLEFCRLAGLGYAPFKPSLRGGAVVPPYHGHSATFAPGTDLEAWDRALLTEIAIFMRIISLLEQPGPPAHALNLAHGSEDSTAIGTLVGLLTTHYAALKVANVRGLVGVVVRGNSYDVGYRGEHAILVNLEGAALRDFVFASEGIAGAGANETKMFYCPSHSNTHTADVPSLELTRALELQAKARLNGVLATLDNDGMTSVVAWKNVDGTFEDWDGQAVEPDAEAHVRVRPCGGCANQGSEIPIHPLLVRDRTKSADMMTQAVCSMVSGALQAGASQALRSSVDTQRMHVAEPRRRPICFPTDYRLGAPSNPDIFWTFPPPPGGGGPGVILANSFLGSEGFNSGTGANRLHGGGHLQATDMMIVNDEGRFVDV
ncbi:hypothetical protein TeGR_g3020 [Tetraparma gracilis]|uniref:Uncharacterized protein n=1 Tax=Tetraparma gracilis TaxID=2962635 RepID=A0ABQ6MBN6_9STRA|nr:hypothetical protein TeGR_g3020 [Tetraparma gracilis]